jgi:hypothetical protein
MNDSVSQEWIDYQKGKTNHRETSPQTFQIYTINPAGTALGSNLEMYLKIF